MNKRMVKVGDRYIGNITGDSFRKRVKGSLHQLRNPKAWCISKEAFIEQVLPNTQTIVIEDVESELEYYCSTESFNQHCFEICRGNFEPQLACPTRFFQVDGNGNHQLSFW